MTSSNGNIFALLAICAGNSPVPGEFPTQRPVTRGFGVSFDQRLNKRLSKQSWGWRFERYRAHYYVSVMGKERIPKWWGDICKIVSTKPFQTASCNSDEILFLWLQRPVRSIQEQQPGIVCRGFEQQHFLYISLLNRLPKWFQSARNFQCLSLMLETRN